MLPQQISDERALIDTMTTQAELDTADWRRLLEIAALTASEQDRRILDELRRAAANGVDVPEPQAPAEGKTC